MNCDVYLLTLFYLCILILLFSFSCFEGLACLFVLLFKPKSLNIYIFFLILNFSNIKHNIKTKR